MEVLTIAVMGVVCITCFMIGAKVGQTVSRGEKVELPSIDPLKAVREHQEKKAEEKERNRLDTILRNIEAYDGTEGMQEDVPRG
jgi:hypothetical protein